MTSTTFKKGPERSYFNLVVDITSTTCKTACGILGPRNSPGPGTGGAKIYCSQGGDIAAREVILLQQNVK
jgi:hypothetical protein